MNVCKWRIAPPGSYDAGAFFWSLCARYISSTFSNASHMLMAGCCNAGLHAESLEAAEQQLAVLSQTLQGCRVPALTPLLQVI